MGVGMETMRIVLPVLVTGAIAVFVILRMKQKYVAGTLCKKKKKEAQYLLDSLIPLGMLVGCAVAPLISLFSSLSFITTIAWGPGIGLLIGYLAYERYSKMEESY
ncbi:MAG TPA: hypothetical protein VK142_07800 [Bacillota bacterium]|nr:hypothetical protein [Bacillota bacterium]